MRIVGIDPGKKGASGLVVDGVAEEAANLPFNDKERIDSIYLSAWILDWEPDFIVIERVRAMPSQGNRKRKMGAQSMFNFGFGAGKIEAMVELLDIPFEYVEPYVWKRRAGLIGQPKEASLERAKAHWHDIHDYLTPKRGVFDKEMAIGRAEALLIAHYGLII